MSSAARVLGSMLIAGAFGVLIACTILEVAAQKLVPHGGAFVPFVWWAVSGAVFALGATLVVLGRRVPGRDKNATGDG